MELDFRDRIVYWLWQRIRPIYPTAVLLIGIIAVLISSVLQAEWVTDSTPMINSLWLGIGFGILLSLSHFNGLFAAGYSIFIAVFYLYQELGDLFSNLSVSTANQIPDILNQLNVRAFIYWYRISGWFGSIQSGNQVNDTGLFVLLISLILWQAGAWLTWWVIRKKQAFPGILPLGFLLTLNVYLARQEKGYLFIFLVITVLLLSRTAFTSIHVRWNKRQIDYPEDLGFDWGGSSIIAAILVGGIALFSTVIGTPEGWQWLSDLFRPIRQQTSDTADQLFTGVKPPEISSSGNALSIQLPDLTQIGNPLPSGNQTVMWVEISDPPPPTPNEIEIGIQDQTRIHYWRDTVFSQYTGRGWLSMEPFARPGQILLSENIPETRYELIQKYEISAAHGNVLFSVNQPAGGSEGVSLWFIEPDGNSLTRGTVSKYEVISWAAKVTSNQLKRALPVSNPAILATYLQLPGSLPRRVYSLNSQLIGEEKNAYEIALKIQNFLRQNYKYSLEAVLAPDGRDVVDYFLFDAPGGFCTHYASAMVVMLRINGIPSRIATGYTMGFFDHDRGAYRVPVSASHAWVEIYFEGIGWVEFEPTPSQQVILYPDEIDPSETLTTENVPLPSGISAFRRGIIGFGVFAGALGLAYWLYRLSIPKRYDNRTIIGETEKLYWSMRLSFIRSGYLAERSMTPLEFYRIVFPNLERYPELREALESLTKIYIQAAYSARLPSQNELILAKHSWSRSFWQRVYLRINQLFAASKKVKEKQPKINPDKIDSNL